jgi:putative toxin-antitoxin system antitoxin component (TIGR02293 family)
MLLSSVTQLLGGRKTLGREIRTQVDLVDLSRTGVTKASLLHLAEYMGSPVSQIAVLLPTTERTIQRYSPHQHFNQSVSESILHIAEVVARGTEVFGDKRDFLAWLEQASIPLGSRSPKSLLSSRFGAGMVLDELTRIEHGIVS